MLHYQTRTRTTYMFNENRKFAHFWQKRTFSYKVARQKFSWLGQKGGHRTVPPLKYATAAAVWLQF